MVRLLLALPLLALAATANASPVSDQKSSVESNHPAWLDRIFIEGSAGTDAQPHYSVETIQPLWKPDDGGVLFIQGRSAYDYDKDDTTFNLGTGYRWLNGDETRLYGVNAFYDRQWKARHERYGVGGEMMTPYLTLRGNIYQGLSGWQEVKHLANATVEERVMDGADVEIETPMPFMPWARFGLSGYHWGGKEADDLDGVQTRLNMDITRRTSLETGFSADRQDFSGIVKLRVALGEVRGEKPTMLENGFGAARAFEERKLRDHMLDRVIRHNDIVVEQRTRGAGTIGGVVVRIRRGS